MKKLDNSFLKFIEIMKLNSDYTLIINIDKPIIDSRISSIAWELWLSPKEEFHFTIIWTKTAEIIASIVDNLNIEEKLIIIDKINVILNKFEFRLTRKNEFYFLEKFYEEKNPQETRKTIIEILEISWIEDFYNELNKILGIKFEIPFWHITLFSSSDNPKNKLRWIWIYSNKQFLSLKTKKL